MGSILGPLELKLPCARFGEWLERVRIKTVQARVQGMVSEVRTLKALFTLEYRQINRWIDRWMDVSIDTCACVYIHIYTQVPEMGAKAQQRYWLACCIFHQDSKCLCCSAGWHAVYYHQDKQASLLLWKLGQVSPAACARPPPRQDVVLQVALNAKVADHDAGRHTSSVSAACGCSIPPNPPASEHGPGFAAARLGAIFTRTGSTCFSAESLSPNRSRGRTLGSTAVGLPKG